MWPTLTSLFAFVSRIFKQDSFVYFQFFFKKNIVEMFGINLFILRLYHRSSDRQVYISGPVLITGFDLAKIQDKHQRTAAITL